jgi:dienelactone hydrolase
MCKPSVARFATYEPPPYAHPERFQEHEVQIGHGKWVLPGIVSIPQGDGPFAAVLLVHGSGSQDRDETIPPNKPFRDLAWGLTSQGIAVLRYEKRTKVYAASMRSEMDTVTVKEEVIDDALEAVALLRDRPEIDAQQIFVLGHSLGGYLAPRIGAADPQIRGLIILAGSARPLEDVLLDQMTYVLSLSIPDPVARQQQLAVVKKTSGADQRSQTLADSDSDRFAVQRPGCLLARLERLSAGESGANAETADALPPGRGRLPGHAR